MNNSIDFLANSVFEQKIATHANTISDNTVVESRYLLAKKAPLSELSKGALEDDTVSISADAVKSLQLEQQSKSSESKEADAEKSDLFDELIEETKDKIDQAKRALEDVVGNSESAKQHRKALQTQLMLLNNQLLLLINQKADNLAQSPS